MKNTILIIQNITIDKAQNRLLFYKILCCFYTELSIQEIKSITMYVD